MRVLSFIRYRYDPGFIDCFCLRVRNSAGQYGCPGQNSLGKDVGLYLFGDVSVGRASL